MSGKRMFEEKRKRCHVGHTAGGYDEYYHFVDQKRATGEKCSHVGERAMPHDQVTFLYLLSYLSL